VLNEQKHFRFVLSRLKVHLACDQIVLFILASKLVVVLPYVCDDSDKADFLFFNALSNHIKLIQMCMHGVRTNVSLLVLLLLQLQL
jgi:hypothetical protein